MRLFATMILALALAVTVTVTVTMSGFIGAMPRPPVIRS